MYKLEEFKEKGYDVTVGITEHHIESPRIWDNLGILVGYHKRYNLVDEEFKPSPHGDNWQDGMCEYFDHYLHDWCEDWLIPETSLKYGGDDYEKGLEKVWELIDEKEILCLPVYMYEHSNIALSTTPFGCRWDSGQLGFIFCTKEMMEEEGITRDKAKEILRAEIKVLDQYTSGEVYEYIIEKDGEEIDSCSGYFGDLKDIVKEAKSICKNLSQ